jgi:hypothetical protein
VDVALPPLPITLPSLPTRPTGPPTEANVPATPGSDRTCGSTPSENPEPLSTLDEIALCVPTTTSAFLYDSA